MKKVVKKVVSILMMTAMVSTVLPQDFVVRAAKNQAVEIDYSELNNEIYDNLEDYPVGNMEDTGEIPDDAIQVKNVQEYYEAVGENAPMALGDETALADSLPSAVDNSTNENAKYFPPIVNQIGGSCTAYAYIYNMGTYTLNKARGTDASKTENQLCPLFVYNVIRDSYSTGAGISCSEANKVIQSIGVPTAEVAPISDSYDNYRYTWYPTEEAWTSATNNRIESAVYLRDIRHTGTPITSAQDSDLDLLKTTLSDGNLVAFATYFCTFNYTLIPEGSASHAGEHAVDRCDYYWSNGDGSRYVGGHSMVIVGYDDDIWIDVNQDGKKQSGEFGALKIANSHGDDYKNSGFVWVAYDAINKVSSVITDADATRVNNAIDAGEMTGSKIQKQYRVPFFSYSHYCYTYTASSGDDESSGCRLVATLNTSDRDQVSMDIIATNKLTGTQEEYEVEVFELTNWTEKFALDGSKNATDGTIVIDLNHVVADISKEKINDYIWSVHLRDDDSSSAPLTVKDLHITADNAEILKADVSNDYLNGYSKIYEITKNASVEITDFSVSEPSPISVVDCFELTSDVEGGSGNYEYRFGTIFNGKEYELSNGYQSSSSTIVSSLSHLISSGDGSGTAEAVGTHTLFVDAKDKESGEVVRKTINNYQVKPLEITSFTADKVSPQSVGTTIKLNAEVKYEALYRYNSYRFSIMKDGVEVASTSGGYSMSWTPKEAGTYTITYYVRDYLGQEATATMDYVITDTKTVVYYQNTSWDQAYIHYKADNGEWTTVPGIRMEESGEQNGYRWKYVIDAENVTLCFNNGKGNWDSRSGANYSVETGAYGIKDGNINKLNAVVTPTVNPTVTPTVTPTVKPTATPTTGPVPTSIVTKNQSTIYYSNAAWNQAYIHFKTNDGSWTAVPGVKMEDNTSANGYTWKYVIDLNKADGATLCFNNGNGGWDSNNGANYSVGKGSFGIRNGKTEELQEGISVTVATDKEVGGTFTESVFTAQAANGTAPYTYQFAIVNAGQVPSENAYVKATGNTYKYTPYSAREYTVYVKVTDAAGETAQASMNYTVEGPKWGEFTATADNHKVGTIVKLKAEYLNYKQDSYNSYSFVIEKDGAETEKGAGVTGYLEWTPEEEGTYTITACFHTYTGETYKTSMEYTVSNGNTVTVYYNSTWDNAYIHYCVDEKSWTAVPGMAMEKCTEKEGYNYKYVIELGDADKATVCFNNGNGSWDSKNGSNYTLTTGTRCISNGNIY